MAQKRLQLCCCLARLILCQHRSHAAPKDTLLLPRCCCCCCVLILQLGAQRGRQPVGASGRQLGQEGAEAGGWECGAADWLAQGPGQALVQYASQEHLG